MPNCWWVKFGIYPLLYFGSLPTITNNQDPTVMIITPLSYEYCSFIGWTPTNSVIPRGDNCKNNRGDTFIKRTWHQMTVITTTTPTSATITRIPLGLEPTAYYACCCCLLLMLFILIYSNLIYKCINSSINVWDTIAVHRTYINIILYN